MHNLLSEAQFGFRKNHSTATCILKLTDTIYRNVNDGLPTRCQINVFELELELGVVFLDLKKAFDTIDHGILLSKLNTFNLTQKSIDRFGNYLSDRFQAVHTLGVTSTFEPLICGVPQGSILGPMLFILYINDLEKCLDSARFSLYADDTAMYVPKQKLCLIFM